jgi:RimJ/RimL family protein N-acetyltransferase
MLPDSFTTARLVAERLREEDLAAVHRMHQDAEQMAHLGGVRDEAQTAAYMERNLAHWTRHGFGLWLLRTRSDDAVAGRVLLRHLDLDGRDEVEVGYSLEPRYWGRGLAAEAAAACLDWARDILHLDSVVALTSPENLRSHRVLTKLGLELERTIELDGHLHALFRIRFAGRFPALPERPR